MVKYGIYTFAEYILIWGPCMY